MSLGWQDAGIVLSIRPHGENGGILSLLTAEHGRALGYVYGATSSRQRGVLQTGNRVAVDWQAKASGQLGNFTAELEKACVADVLDDPLKLTALQSAAALADKALPEGEKHPGVYRGFCALLDAFAAEGDIWRPTYIFWELGLLRELGFGLDLAKCVSTGTTEDLLYVSPRSGCAVSRAAGEIYKERLLALPPFLRGEARFEPQDILDGLKLTGHFFLHRVFAQAHSPLPEARQRLEEKISAEAGA
jgi:DNA repair protein RecO (recombination protein O)